MKPSLHDIAAAAKLVMPPERYEEVATGNTYAPCVWDPHTDEFQPENYGCDWLARFARQARPDITVRELQAIEAIMHAEGPRCRRDLNPQPA